MTGGVHRGSKAANGPLRSLVALPPTETKTPISFDKTLTEGALNGYQEADEKNRNTAFVACGISAEDTMRGNERNDMERKRLISSAALGAAAFVTVAAAGVAFAVQVPIKYQDGAVWGLHALPGDVLPPFGIPDASGHLPPYPAPPPGANPGPLHVKNKANPESTAEGPPLDLAISGAEAALHECERQDRLGSVAVVDIAGDIRVAMSMDGTDGTHVFVAARKALTALEFEKPSVEVKAAAMKGDPDTLARVKPAMFVQFGGFPLRAHGKVIGAIGYSGGIDEPCAKAGADYIQARLPK